ncbi:hypothetical protein MKW94_030865 [Papaver nudicaule]|uniref:Uncharacterized protein n=1 Tax=Papaver nudicaule TaxID=74823 RepID=A0AA41VUN6_PAPNU|nr:hypothetical protein [Papaver nudicaule]
MPPENVERVSQKARDHYELVPDDEVTERISAKAIAAREKQVLNHTNGSQSFTRKLFERKLKGLAIDPLTMFKETHKENKAKLPQICKQWMVINLSFYQMILTTFKHIGHF